MLNHKLTVIIPCFNEEKSICHVLKKITEIGSNIKIPIEVIVVNDGSTDNTSQKITHFINNSQHKIIEVLHKKNQGKGACIRTALNYTTGSIIIIQDADLEYDPKEYTKMLPLIIEDKADVVYGSRFRGSEPHRVLFFMHTIGNKFLTFMSNVFTKINLSDMETGFKMFKTDVLKQIHLKENRFGFEPEVTAKISHIKNIRIYEVGISYYGRTYEEGKKIRWADGVRALFCILKYNIFSKK
jgi:glycosyltransferase involved in cell wall biosynthesis